tara:strand:+ start:1867 stop:2742 length:876 start_codon:yes stop_codon:yes gene_type:complete
MKTKVVLSYIFLCIIWGTTWIILKKSLIEGTPPFFGAGLRFFLAGLILWVFILYKKELPPFSLLSIKIYFQFGVLNLAISYGLTYWATQYIYSSLSSIIWSGFPITVAVFSHFMLPDESITKKKIISLILGTIGAIFVLSNNLSLLGNKIAIGIAMVILAVIIASYPSVYLKKYNANIRSTHINAVSQIIAGALLLIISFLTEAHKEMNWSNYNIFALAYLTIPGSIIAWSIYIWLYSYISMAQISYIAFFPPLIASLLGWIILEETLSLITIVGGIMIIIGTILVYSDHN